MKHSKLIAAAGAAAILLGGALSSCNKESDDLSFVSPTNLAVTNFKLKYTRDAQGVDSAYFSIDLEHGVIFNADSLRRGTPVNKLVAEITYSATIDRATIIMDGGSTRVGEIDYKNNPTDSIDFTGNVRLVIGYGDNEASYRIKVNVHKELADSLVWDETALASLPSRLGNPSAQKTVSFGDVAVCLLRESDGSYTLSTSSDLMANQWNKREITFPFTPQVESLSNSSDAVYILDSTGNLYRSADMTQWTATGETWESIIGGYNETVVGLRNDGGTLRHAQYPKLSISETAIPSDFPVKGRSNFVTLTNKWTSSPVAFFAGGVTSDGSVSSDTWAFDGSDWVKLGSGGIPAVESATIVPYYTYRPSATGEAMLEYDVWMLIGGRMADGQSNRTVYVSYNNGVNWAPGNSLMQLPEVIPAMAGCDNVVMTTEKSSNISDAWTRIGAPARISHKTDGDVISWDCPYIYIFGGYSPDNRLYDTIWRGVLNRLTFTPII